MPPKRTRISNRQTDYTVQVDADGTLLVSDVAKLLCYKPQGVRAWFDRGCPVAIEGGQGRGRMVRLHLDDVVNWLISEREAALRHDMGGRGEDDGSPYDYEDAKARDKHYQALSRQADAYEKIKALIPVDVIADTVDREYAEVSAALLSVPTRVATPLSATNDTSEITRIVQAEIDAALSSLSTGEEIATESGADTSRSALEEIQIDEISDEEVSEDVSD